MQELVSLPMPVTVCVGLSSFQSAGGYTDLDFELGVWAGNSSSLAGLGFMKQCEVLAVS